MLSNGVMSPNQTAGANGTRRARGRVIAALLVTALSAALGAWVTGCKKGDEANAYAPPPPPEVIVANPVVKDVVSYLTYTGTIEASETVDLRARVPGFLVNMNFQPGQRVKKGDILFVIDKSQYQNEVESAMAAKQAAEAAFEGADNDARLARELADQRAGPEIDAIIKAAKRDVAKADISRAASHLVDAQLNLGYCDVTSPIDGRITTNNVDIGNLVGGTGPTVLATIVLSTPAYVSVDVSESDVLMLRGRFESAAKAGKNEPGQPTPDKWPCELALAGQTEFKYPGRVDYLAPQLNTQTGTLRVRTMFENADEVLLPGYFARVRFPMETHSAILVPEAALLSDQQGRYALVVGAGDKVEAKRVTLGVLEGEMRVVESGLESGDRVIVLGVLKARPGSVVTPKTAESSGKAKKPAGKPDKPTDATKEPAAAGR
jgi:RND family efflux transporter MFP subunit